MIGFSPVDGTALWADKRTGSRLSGLASARHRVPFAGGLAQLTDRNERGLDEALRICRSRYPQGSQRQEQAEVARKSDGGSPEPNAR